ncbi:hypothetical protein DOCECA_09120 [Pseudomonas sp. E102]
MCRRLREQARSHRGLGCPWDSCQPQIQCGSEPARDGGASVDEDAECAGVFASRLAPTGGCVALGIQVSRRFNVGASLLAMAVLQLRKMLNVPASSRAGSLPQGGCVALGIQVSRESGVGASLLAMAVLQLMKMPNVPASSRAGSLPRGLCCPWDSSQPQIQCGSELARDGCITGNGD